MNWRNTILFALSLVGIVFAVSAASVGDSSTHIFFRTEQNNLIIQGSYFNKQFEPFEGQYRLIINAIDEQNNQSRNTQGNKLSLDPGEARVLSTVKIGLHDVQKITARLLILSSNGVDTLEDIQKEYITQPDAEGLEFQGLILDETRGRLGHVFYESFQLAFDPPESLQYGNITIIEQPLPGSVNRSAIEVELDDTSIINTYLPSRNDEVEDLAKNVANALINHLAQQQNLNDLIREASGDVKGSGI